MERSEKKEPRLKVFQERFELLRKERDLSNTEFAKFLDMSRQTVGFYLNGDRVPDALMLRQIAEKCNVSADWLLGLTNDNAKGVRAVDALGISSKAVNSLLEIAAVDADTLSDFLSSERFLALIIQIYRVKYTVQTIKAAHKSVHEMGLKEHFNRGNVLKSLEELLGNFLGYPISFVEPHHKIYGDLEDVKMSAENIAKEISGYNDLSAAERSDHIYDFEERDIKEFAQYLHDVYSPKNR